MKTKIFLLLIISIVYCKEQNTTEIVAGEEYKGIIFTDSFSITYPDGEAVSASYFVPTETRGLWTPSTYEISLLEQDLKSYNQNELKFKNLSDYYRQYIGYLGSSEEKIIWVNLVNIDGLEAELTKLPLIVQDADSSAFSLNYNIESSDFFDLRFY